MIFSKNLSERGEQTEQRGFVTKLRTDCFSQTLPERGEQTEQMIFSSQEESQKKSSVQSVHLSQEGFKKK